MPLSKYRATHASNALIVVRVCRVAWFVVGHRDLSTWSD